MSRQYPRSYETARAAIIAFLRACDPHMDKLHDRQLLKSEIERIRGGTGALESGLKNTGMKRPVDDLGRVVVPKELRTTLGWEYGTPIEFFIDSDGATVVMQKFKMEKCAICGFEDNLTKIKDKFICEDCISKVFEGGE